MVGSYGTSGVYYAIQADGYYRPNYFEFPSRKN